MAGLLRLMLTEEFRVHTSYSGRLAFLAFPIIITGFSLAIAVTGERPFTYTPFGDAILLPHASVFLYGLSVGAFGFLGRQYLERTNGTRNYVVAMPGILPMRLRKTFFGMYVRDAIFYVALLLAPASLGLIVSIPITHFRIVSIGVLFGTALLSFLLGMSLSFFVSTLYMRSQIAFLISVGGITALFAAAGTTRSLPLAWILPALAAHEHLPPFPTDAIAPPRPIRPGMGIVVPLWAAGGFLVPQQYEPRAVAAREEAPRLVHRLKRVGRSAPLPPKE